MHSWQIHVKTRISVFFWVRVNLGEYFSCGCCMFVVCCSALWCGNASMYYLIYVLFLYNFLLSFFYDCLFSYFIFLSWLRSVVFLAPLLLLFIYIFIDCFYLLCIIKCWILPLSYLFSFYIRVSIPDSFLPCAVLIFNSFEF